MTEQAPIAEVRPERAEPKATRAGAQADHHEELPSLAAMPSTVARGVCIWLTSSHPPILAEIAPALCDRLRAQRRDVELLSALATGEAPPLRLDPSDDASRLADQASALLHHGVTVVVAHPLAGVPERALVRSRVDRMVEVYIRTEPTPLRSSEGIPVIYRWMTNGRVEEGQLADPLLERPDRPDVIVDGTLGSSPEVAGDILDVLERAGWIREDVALAGRWPDPDSPVAESVPLAATPARTQPP